MDSLFTSSKPPSFLDVDPVSPPKNVDSEIRQYGSIEEAEIVHKESRAQHFSYVGNLGMPTGDIFSKRTRTSSLVGMGGLGPAKKKEIWEMSLDELLQDQIRGFTKNLIPGEFSKVTGMDRLSQLKERNLDLQQQLQRRREESQRRREELQRLREEIGFLEDKDEKANEGTKIVLEEDANEKVDKTTELDGEPRAVEPEGEPIDTAEAVEKAKAPNGKETGSSIKHGMDLHCHIGLSQDVPAWLERAYFETQALPFNRTPPTEECPVPEPIREVPTTYDNLKLSAVKDDSNAKGKGKDVDGQEVSEKDAGQAVERSRFATRSICVEEFRRKLEEGGEDGYFVSSKWLLRLEKHERESLMSVLWRTGYSEICQTTTTTLFARIEDDVQHQTTYNAASSTLTENYLCLRPTDEFGVLKGVDDQPRIAGPAKKKEKLEIPSAEVLQNENFGLTKNLNPGEFSKVTGEKLNLDLSIKEAQVELLVPQELQRRREEIGFFEDEDEKANEGTKIVLEKDVDKKADKAIEVDGESRAVEPEGEPIDIAEIAEKAKAPNGKESSKAMEIDSVRDSDVGSSIKHGMDPHHQFGLSQDVPSWVGIPLLSSTKVNNIFPSEQQAATLEPLQAALESNTQHNSFAGMLESLQSALKSNTHRKFCVSTKWLSNLKDNEKEAVARVYLEAGYEKINQTSITTWYVGSGGQVENPTDGGDPCDTNSSTLSDKKYVPCGDVSRARTSKRVAFGGEEMLTMHKRRKANSSVGLAKEMSTSHIPCHPQLLSVTCSPSSHASILEPPACDGQFRRQQIGDMVVKMPQRDKLKKLSTTIDKSFPITTIDFLSDGRGQEVSVNLKVITITSLGCCCLPGTDHNLPKVHIEFSRMFGEVKKGDSNEQTCNAMALSCVCTSLGGSVVTRLDGGDDFEEITLTLEDEYHPPQRRVLPTSQQVGTSSTSDLVWLAISDKIIDPSNFPESVTVELRGDVRRRRKADLDSGVQRAHILHFQDPRPLIFEGNIALHPTSFLELHMRHQLEVSYLKPCAPIHENAPVWSAQSTTKVIDLDCYFKIRNEKFEFG